MLQSVPKIQFNFSVVWLLMVFGMWVSVQAAEPPPPQPQCQFRVQFQPELTNDVLTRMYQTYVAQLQTLVAELGCQLVQIEVPAGRAQLLMQSGQLDVMVGMSKNTERQDFMHFVGPHHLERIWVVGHKFEAKGITSLMHMARSQLAMSLTEGAFYGAQFTALMQQPEFRQRLIFVSTNSQKISLLTGDKVSLTLEDEWMLKQMFSNGSLPEAKFKKLFLLYENPIFFAFSKTSISEQQFQQLQQIWQQLQRTAKTPIQ